jgi:hypothetical protein
MKNQNYVLKVVDAKKADIKKALKEAGIEVRAITEVYSEEVGGEKKEGADAEKKSDA